MTLVGAVALFGALMSPPSSEQVEISGNILEAVVSADARFDLSTAPWVLTMTMLVRIPMIAITIKSSTNVNPFLNFILFFVFVIRQL